MTTAPSSPVPAVERIELPGGWHLKNTAERRWTFDLCSPTNWHGTLYMGSDEGIAAFAAAMSPTPGRAAEPDMMGRATPREIAEKIVLLAVNDDDRAHVFAKWRPEIDEAETLIRAYVRTIVTERDEARAETAEAQPATRGWQELGDWRPKPWVRIDLWIQCYDLADRDSDRLVPTVGKRVPSAVWFDGQWCNGDGNPHEDFEGFEDARITHWRPEPAPPLSSSGADR